jgi:hypothetical protein
MGSGKYIGRVGALAVALGIGAGLAAAPWAAYAKPSESDSSSANASGGRASISVSTNGVVRHDSDPTDTTVATTQEGTHSVAIARGDDSTATATGGDYNRAFVNGDNSTAEAGTTQLGGTGGSRNTARVVGMTAAHSPGTAMGTPPPSRGTTATLMALSATTLRQE